MFISAPPGYGKTSLLRLLAGQQPNSFLVALELGDADAGQLQTRLQAYLRPGAALLLDEAQFLLNASEALAWLVAQTRAVGLHLVLSGRQMPLAPEALDMAGGVTLLTERDLAFTLNESEALLAAAGRAAEPLLASWHARAAGWPLALALLARRPEHLPELAARAASQPPGELFDALAQTLMQGVPLDLQRFMALTAVPLRFNDALAASLLGVTADEAARARAEVLRRNLFLTETEASAPGWFRYHDLIRDFMLARLALFGEDRQARFRQTAEWFAARGDLPLAIEHALAGQLNTLAAALITRLPLEFVRNEGRYHSFRRWVLGLDPVTLSAHPLLLERLGYELLDINQNAEAWQHLNTALRLAEAEANVSAQYSIRLTMAKAHRFEGRPQAAVDICRALRADPQLPPDLLRRALSAEANSYVQLSQFTLARRAYQQLLETVEQPGTLPNAFYRANLASVALVPLGDYLEAQRLLEANDSYFADKPVGRGHHWLGWCALHEARGQWDDLERALQAFGAAEAQAEQPDSNNIWTSWWWTLLDIGRGHFALAWSKLEQTQALVGPNPEEVICVAIARAWLLRREGRHAKARQAAEDILNQTWESPLYRASLALERDLSGAAEGGAPALHPETLNVARLRARAQTMRLRALLAARCARAGDPRWRRHAAAVLRTLGRAGYTGLLTRRDPDLASQFWIVCLRANFAVDEAVAGLRELAQIAPLLPLLAEADPAVRARAAGALALLGGEEAMPALAEALATESDTAAARALEAALQTLEQAPPPTLQARLMGEFSVRRGERAITDWHRPAVRRLFQYLLLHRGERLARDRILDDLWPDADPATARASFNQAFSWLRRLLEPAMRPRAVSRYLALDADSYCFDPRRDPKVTQVDTEAFEAAVRPSLEQAEHPDLLPLPPALLAALAGWQPLLPEAPYEGWVVEPRERLLNLYIEGCLYAARSLLERARPAEAAPWAARVVAAAPWREEAYQALMQAQARQGARSLALKTFAEAVAALQRELSAEPSALTRWLGQRLQQGEDI